MQKLAVGHETAVGEASTGVAEDHEGDDAPSARATLWTGNTLPLPAPRAAERAGGACALAAGAAATHNRASTANPETTPR